MGQSLMFPEFFSNLLQFSFSFLELNELHRRIRLGEWTHEETETGDRENREREDAFHIRPGMFFPLPLPVSLGQDACRRRLPLLTIFHLPACLLATVPEAIRPPVHLPALQEGNKNACLSGLPGMSFCF